ncbi:MAG: hypothetical protein U1A78_19070 [Polyangia bacterium]
MSSANTSMVPYNPNQGVVAPTQQGGFRAKINGVDVTFASEADYLKADRALREMVESQNVPSLGGMTSRGAGGGLNWLRTGANAADAVAGFLNGRNIRRKLDDLDDSLVESRDARQELDNIERSNSTLAPLIPVLRRLFLAERDATEASISVLEDQLTAVDIQAGSGVAKVAADLVGSGTLGTSTGEGSGLGPALAAGGAGLGLGLLLSNNRDSDRSRRRRR